MREGRERREKKKKKKRGGECGDSDDCGGSLADAAQARYSLSSESHGRTNNYGSKGQWC
jgi:hypothetical protein